VREPVESRTARGKILPSRLLSSNLKLTQANLLILKAAASLGCDGERGRPGMVKPSLRTKSIGFKVSQEEYAQLETAAQADGRTLGEWCREAILRGGSASDDPALAEIVGVRLLFQR
jgi:hypothetical protein